MKALTYKLKEEGITLGKEILDVTWTLYKVTIPVLIIIKIIESLGGIAYISSLLTPLMGWMGLPGEMGIVWATTILLNMYAGILVYISLEPSLTIAQVSVLGTIMLVAHGLPVEVAIAKKAGVGVLASMLTRLGGALILGVVLNWVYQYFYLLQDKAQLMWEHPVSQSDDLMLWVIAQLESLLMIFIIIAILMTLLRLLKAMGVESLMIKLLSPLLKLLGISPAASNITIVGITLGISFGGGLLINEAKKGHVSAKDIFLAMTLLNLLHSLIEDTILILMLGADFTTVFWIRILFSILVTMMIAFTIKFMSEDQRQKWLYKTV